MAPDEPDFDDERMDEVEEEKGGEKQRTLTEEERRFLAWIRKRKKLPAQDMDDVCLITGPERSGKSTLALQINKALDPNFGVENIAFTVEEFIRKAKSFPRGSVLQLDEALINRRKAMYGATIKLHDFLQVCGGLRHHITLCFPHVDFLDRPLIENRVRWRVHVPGGDEVGKDSTFRPGVFVVYQAYRKSVVDPRIGPTSQLRWIKLGEWKFAPRHDQLEADYLAAKEAFMRSQEDDTTFFKFFEATGTHARRVYLKKRKTLPDGPTGRLSF